MDSSEKSTSSSIHSCHSIDEPNPDDVLLGRAASVFHHPGNRRYRHIVALNLKRYKEAKSRLDKMVLIREVTEQILDNGRVKFLRPSSEQPRLTPNQPQKWVEVPVRVAQDKVSHALRDGINKPIFAPLMGDHATTEDADYQSYRNKESDEDDSHQSDNQRKEENEESQVNSNKQVNLDSKLQNPSSKSEISNTSLISPPTLQNSFNLALATAARNVTMNNDIMNPASTKFIHHQAPPPPPQLSSPLGRISAATAATRAALARLTHESAISSSHAQQTSFPSSFMNYTWNVEQKLLRQQKQEQQLLLQRQLMQLQLQQRQIQRQNVMAMALDRPRISNLSLPSTMAPTSILDVASSSSSRRLPGSYGLSSPLLAGLPSVVPNIRAPFMDEPGRILPTTRPQLYNEMLRSPFVVDTLLRRQGTTVSPPTANSNVASVNNYNNNNNASIATQSETIALAQMLYLQQKQQQLAKEINCHDKSVTEVEKGRDHIDLSSEEADVNNKASPSS
jgi:hypothetical protein